MNTGVTDTGLVHLQRMSRLERLRLEGTMVTDEGAKRLQQSLPHCKITR